jgi:hypothetical protein
VVCLEREGTDLDAVRGSSAAAQTHSESCALGAGSPLHLCGHACRCQLCCVPQPHRRAAPALAGNALTQACLRGLWDAAAAVAAMVVGQVISGHPILLQHASNIEVVQPAVENSISSTCVGISAPGPLCRRCRRRRRLALVVVGGGGPAGPR